MTFGAASLDEGSQQAATSGMRWLWLCLAVAGAAACFDSPPGLETPTIAPQGVVAGFVRDTTGRGLGNVVMCTVAIAVISGTPVIISATERTQANGAYLVPINVRLDADIRASVAVTANPAMGSGLEANSARGPTVLITRTGPPAETTYVDIVLHKGSPLQDVFCMAP
jgi:hypothetical protein